MTHLLPQQAWAFLHREPTAPFIDARLVIESPRVGRPLALGAGPAWERS